MRARSLPDSRPLIARFAPARRPIGRPLVARLAARSVARLAARFVARLAARFRSVLGPSSARRPSYQGYSEPDRQGAIDAQHRFFLQPPERFSQPCRA